MMTDNLAAALDEIRKRHAVIALPCGDVAIVIGRFKHSTDDVPRLLAALDEVLKLHHPAIGQPEWCEESGFSWPCSTHEAISRALLGEEGDE